MRVAEKSVFQADRRALRKAPGRERAAGVGGTQRSQYRGRGAKESLEMLVRWQGQVKTAGFGIYPECSGKSWRLYSSI